MLASILPALGQALAPIVTPLLVALLGGAVAALPKGFAWLNAHAKISKSAAANGVLQRFLGLVELEMLAAAQTTVDTAKSDLASGKIDRATADKILADVKAAVIAKAKAQASSQGILSDVEKVLGVGDGATVEAFASSAVEALLAKLKMGQPK